MELKQYLAMIRQRWISALLAALLVLASVITGTVVQASSYETTTRLIVQTRTDNNVSDLNGGLTFASQQIATYADLATSPMVLDRVVDQLELDIPSQVLADAIVTTTPPDTLILEITVTSTDPAEAAAVANSTANSLRAVVTELAPATSGSAVELTVIAPAMVPTEPTGPNLPRNIAIGLLLGALVGIAVAVARAMLDNRVHTLKDAEESTGHPVLAVVQTSHDRQRAPLVMQDFPHSLEAESYRELRTNLRFMGVRSRSNSVLVTSSMVDEGKSTTAINLAYVLAQAGNRVLLIDCDLRRPSVATYLGLEGSVGLTTVLIGEADIEEVTQPLDTAGLEVLASGQIPPNPSEMIGSPAMARVLDTASARYDMVVIDSPPLLAATDTALLSRLVGGSVVVSRSGVIRRPQLHAALEKLAAVGSPVLGLVLNGVPRRSLSSYFTQPYQYVSTGGAPLPLEAAARALRRGDHAQDVDPAAVAPSELTVPAPMGRRRSDASVLADSPVRSGRPSDVPTEPSGTESSTSRPTR